MSETCGTCRHWKRPEVRDGYGNAARYEARGPEDWDELEARQDAEDVLFGECRGVIEGWDLNPQLPAPLAVVQDGSDYRATLFSQAEFGCALWVAKEAEL